MIVICEGLDKCGKSTYLSKMCASVINVDKTLSPELLNIKAMPQVVGFHLLQGAYEMCWLRFAVELVYDHGKTVYFDRCVLSDMAYGPVFREGTYYDFEDIKGLLNAPHMILWFDTNKYAENLDKTDVYESDLEKLKQVRKNYRTIMRRLKREGYNVYKVNYDV